MVEFYLNCKSTGKITFISDRCFYALCMDIVKRFISISNVDTFYLEGKYRVGLPRMSKRIWIRHNMFDPEIVLTWFVLRHLSLVMS